MNWNFVKNTVSIDNLKKIENELSCSLPSDFVKTVTIYNGGCPEKVRYDLLNVKEKVFDRLVNFDIKSKNNVLSIYQAIKKRTKSNLIPFGEDPFGNYICFLFENNNQYKIVFWDHEQEASKSITFISNTFSEFIEKLY